MLPYFEQPVWHVGPLTIHAFGVTVAAAMWLGLALVQQRFEQTGLDGTIGNRLGTWMIVGGIAGAHLFSVLLYFRDKVAQDPWLLFRVWEDISSFGGMLGAVAGAFLFFALRAPSLDHQAKVAYLDAIAFVFPSALAIGRVGCALAHDHPGTTTTFPLAISLKTEAARAYIQSLYSSAGLTFPSNAVGFHALGLYECLFLGLIVVPLFYYWNQRRRPVGFYLVAFAAIYCPVRFCFEMLRVADVRYLRLTPAQWTAAVVVAGLPLAVLGRRKVRFAITGAVILGTALACWGGPG